MKNHLTTSMYFLLIITLTTSCINPRIQKERKRTHEICNMYALTAPEVDKNDNINDVYEQMLRGIIDYAVSSGKSKKTPAEIMEGKKKLEKELRSGKYKKKDEHHAVYKELERCHEPMYQQKAPENLAKIKAIQALILKKHLPEEKRLFEKRSNRNKFCGTKAIDQFLFGARWEKPQKGCMYYNEGNLIAFQATSKGILSRSVYANFEPAHANTIFLQKPNSDSNIADGQRLAPGYFEYKGVFNYPSLLGQRSVHSFKRINITGEALYKGILFYKGR